MNKTKFLIFIITLAVTLPLFHFSASAATENTLSYVDVPRVDMDYSEDPYNAPLLQLKTNFDIEAGAMFQLSLAPGAKFSYGSASMDDIFTKSGNSFTSKEPLSNESGFSYEVSIMTEREMQITTNAKLSNGNYMLIPLIARIDGVAEAKVSVTNGERWGISGGEYIFANPGGVNNANLDIVAKTKQEEKVIAGDIEVSISAGLGNTTFEFTLPGGFVFDNGFKKDITLKGDGSYLGVKISDIWLNNSKTKLSVKISDVKLSTSPGKLTFKNVKTSVVVDAAKGDIVMGFAAYDLNNEKFTFGTYEGVTVVPPEKQPEEKPALPPQEIKIVAASDDKNIIINGKTVEAPVAPYNDENGRMAVPVRFMAMAFENGEDGIKWDAESKTVTLTLATRSSKAEIAFVIGSKEYMVNQAVYTMDTAAVIKDGYTFIPARFVAEAMGLSVNYDPATKTAEFTGIFE